MAAHTLTNIHPDAKIGENTTIESFTTIYGDVVIGDNTWIGPNVTIMDGARIGNNCKIFPGAVIAGIPQDLKFKGERTTAEIGDNTVIRENVTINRGTKTKGKTIIGNNCLVMANAHVAHDCCIGDNVILVFGVGVAGEVTIGDWAIISGLAAIHQFVSIGAHSMIQGLSKVSKDVPPFVIAAREPLSFCGINSIGLRRRNFSNDQILQIQETYRIIYQNGLNINDAINFISVNIPSTPERDEIIMFVKASKRGIIKGILDGNYKATDDF